MKFNNVEALAVLEMAISTDNVRILFKYYTDYAEMDEHLRAMIYERLRTRNEAEKEFLNLLEDNDADNYRTFRSNYHACMLEARYEWNNNFDTTLKNGKVEKNCFMFEDKIHNSYGVCIHNLVK